MALSAWLTYLATVLLLMSTPGPSHLLMLSNSLRHGFPRSLATAAGDLSANLLQMLGAGLGLATMLVASATAFNAVKWLGVAYLAWLGLRMLLRRQRPQHDGEPAPAVTTRALWLQGFMTSAANPKAVVFFAALFPQFIDPQLTLWPQLTVLSLTYLVIDGAFLSCYGVGAGWLASKLRDRRLIDRLGGTFLLGAAVLLGLRSLAQSD